jgi:SAM-dependent methyltransferase
VTPEEALRGFHQHLRGRVISIGGGREAPARAGAEQVVTVGPDAAEVDVVQEDLRRLPFANDTFDLVFVHGVLHRTPPPRRAWLREFWRLVRPGGHLLVTGSPGLLDPRDRQVTGLLWVPWLPSPLAFRYARFRGRFEGDREAWDRSGWRGVGRGEVMDPLRRAIDRSRDRTRHLIQKEPDPVGVNRPEVQLPGTAR